MTFDQQIQVWNAIGTWVAGLATFAAVLVSLWLALDRDRVKLKVQATRKLMVGAGVSQPFISISVTNLGERPVTVTSIGWRVGGRRARRYAFQNQGARWAVRVPAELTHGKTLDLLIEEDDNDWASNMANTFVQSDSMRYLNTLRATVSTSVGQTVLCKPDLSLLTYVQSHFNPALMPESTA